jgi:hypothetical protein
VARRLFTVEHALAIQGRGVALFPGIVPTAGEIFRAGDPLELRRPDGSSVSTRVGSLELVSPPPKNLAVVILLRELCQADVPVGTEVWSVP